MLVGMKSTRGATQGPEPQDLSPQNSTVENQARKRGLGDIIARALKEVDCDLLEDPGPASTPSQAEQKCACCSPRGGLVGREGRGEELRGNRSDSPIEGASAVRPS